MSSGAQQQPEPAAGDDTLPDVCLEVRHAGGRPATYALGPIAFVVGTVPGCDLRLGGTDLPALICLFSRQPGGIAIRKLAPGATLLVNGQPAIPPLLYDGDRLSIGVTEVLVRIRQAAAVLADAADFAKERARLQDAAAQLRAQLTRFHKEKEQSEHSLAERERAIEANVRQYQADLVRLDRQRGEAEEREKKLHDTAEVIQREQARIQQDSADLEEQVAGFDAAKAQLAETEERLTREGQEQQALACQLAQRAAALEGQQTTVAALRTRLERLREELRGREQQLEEQHGRQQAESERLEQDRQALAKLREELDADRRQIEPERQQIADRTRVLGTAIGQLRQAQERFAAEEQRLTQRSAELDALAAKLVEQEAMVEDRLTQLAEAQERLDAERQALRDRSVTLTKGEQARESLQEQLRRRAEELAARQTAVDEEAERHRTAEADLEARLSAAEREQAEAKQRVDALQEELGRRAAELDQHQAVLTGREQSHRTQAEQLAGLSRTLHEEQASFREEQETALERLGRERAEFETMRREAAGLFDQLPDMELRVNAGLERLAQAREQLRDHLAQVHQYVRQCQDDLERLRSRIQADVEGLEQQEQALRLAQDEHRLAMVAFQQQLIDWQGQIGELRRSLAHDETRLERRQAQVEEKVKEIDATSQRLAEQAEVLQEQQREVQDRRHEVDNHLVDMREWYRHKLRDLAGISLESMPPAPQDESRSEEPRQDSEDDALVPTGRSILTMPGPVDAGDYQLGETLRTLQLVDADALTVLLAEARRQRRSLRQVLLASGAVTLYQLALIEAGNVAGLMLGPVRVIDRLRSTPFEAVYRVFDPRRGTEAVLRHLAENVMHDAVRPDEFRQRFGQAVLSDPHVAGTLEVLEIAGRPAALQEWLTGVPATDWPPLAAAPGVCYRLLTQAAHGLAAGHRAGLVHGHLTDGLLLLNAEGVLKVCGFGEPLWFLGLAEGESSVRGDLRALGAIVSGWCTPSGVRRGARAKPLPDSLVSVLYRLNAEGDAGYTAADELLEDLEKAAAMIPSNAEAWDRLLRYVREHGTPDTALRRSA